MLAIMLSISRWQMLLVDPRLALNVFSLASALQPAAAQKEIRLLHQRNWQHRVPHP